MSDIIRILYVDDEPDIREIVEIALGLDPRMEIRTAASGAQALDLLDGGHWLPHIALVDMMMPGMTGIELMTALKDRTDMSAVPVVIITASARSTELDRYVSAGASGVISKPFDPMMLAAKVKTFLR
jgi:two-component system OmpR family response regulator